MLNKSKIIVLIAVMLFSIWIIAAPQIISQFKQEGELPLSKTQYVSYGYNGAVTYSLEVINYNPSDYREVVSLKGWSFIDLDEQISQRKISVLFLSENRSYKVEANTHMRPEIVDVYKPGTSSGINSEFGFETSFSAITIKNGEYKIAVAVKEDDTEKVEYTGKILKKEAGRVSFIDDSETGRSSFVEFKVTLSELPEAYGSVDAFTDMGVGRASIYGWAFGKLSQQVKSRNIYAVLASTENRYRAPLQSVSRYGLVKALNEELPADSVLSPAYKGILDFSNVKDGEYRLFQMVSENNLVYLQNPGIIVNKQGETINTKIEKHN